MKKRTCDECFFAKVVVGLDKASGEEAFSCPMSGLTKEAGTTCYVSIRQVVSALEVVTEQKYRLTQLMEEIAEYHQ